MAEDVSYALLARGQSVQDVGALAATPVTRRFCKLGFWNELVMSWDLRWKHWHCTGNLKDKQVKMPFLLRYSQIWRKTKLLDQDVLRCFRKGRSDSPWDCGSILVYTSGKVCRGGRWSETKGNGNASIGQMWLNPVPWNPLSNWSWSFWEMFGLPKFQTCPVFFNFAIWASTSWHFMDSRDFTSSFLLWG